MKKNIFTTAAVLFALLTSFSLVAQNVPDNIDQIPLKSKEDFVKNESVLVDAATWLETTDLDKEPEKRKQIGAFVVKYLSATPDITIEITETLGKIYDKNVDLLVIYMASYAKSVIKNKGNPDKKAAIKAGIVAMRDGYKKNINIIPGKEMDKIVAMTDEELDKYISKKFR